MSGVGVAGRVGWPHHGRHQEDRLVAARILVLRAPFMVNRRKWLAAY
jgi:hypothetical protein